MFFMLSRTSLELPVLFKYQVTRQLLVIIITNYFLFIFLLFFQKRDHCCYYICCICYILSLELTFLYFFFFLKKSFRILQIPQIFNIFFVVSITQYTIDSIGKMILVINLENQIHRKQVTNYFRFPQITPRNLAGSEYMFMTFVSKILLFLLILIHCIVFQRC